GAGTGQHAVVTLRAVKANVGAYTGRQTLVVSMLVTNAVTRVDKDFVLLAQAVLSSNKGKHFPFVIAGADKLGLVHNTYANRQVPLAAITGSTVFVVVAAAV